MGYHRDKTDFLFTQNGELVFDTDKKDIASTKKIPLKGLQQQIEARVNSNKGEWALNPNLGADIKNFLGSPNTKKTADNIREVLTNELLRGGFLKSSEFIIRAFPISDSKLAIFLQIMPTGEAQAYQQIYSFDLSNQTLSRRK